jgi:hypothetical protein
MRRCAQEAGEVGCYAFLAPLEAVAAARTRVLAAADRVRAESAGLDAAKTFIGAMDSLSEEEES